MSAINELSGNRKPGRPAYTGIDFSEIKNLSIRQPQLLNAFYVPTDRLNAFAFDINRRLVKPINSQLYKLLDSLGSFGKKKRGCPPKQKNNLEVLKPKYKPGRPKGYKNRKTIECEASGIIIPQGKPDVPKDLKTRKPWNVKLLRHSR